MTRIWRLRVGLLANPAATDDSITLAFDAAVGFAAELTDEARAGMRRPRRLLPLLLLLRLPLVAVSPRGMGVFLLMFAVDLTSGVAP